MSDFPFYQMYPADFEASEEVIKMDLAAIGLYVKCLNFAWKNGSIPEDTEELFDLLRLRHRDIRTANSAWPLVRKCFVSNGTDGRLVNKRQERDREKAVSKSLVRANAANARWDKMQNECKTDANASGLHMHDASIRASGSVSVSDSEKEKNDGQQKFSKEIRTRWFNELFWPIVWAKVAKPDALKAWLARVHDEETRDLRIKQAKQQGPKIIAKALKNGGTPLYVSTWLNGERHDDEDPIAAGMAANSNGGYLSLDDLEDLQK